VPHEIVATISVMFVSIMTEVPYYVRLDISDVMICSFYVLLAHERPLKRIK
jgi:hypothetical protein